MSMAGFAVRRYSSSLRPLLRIGHVVAMLDMFFLLLFFLLLATSVVRISGIRVNLPQADVPRAAVLGRSIVTIAPPAEPGMPCRMFFRDRPIDVDGLRRELLTDANREKVLVIRADRDVPAGVLAEVMTIAESARMETFIPVQPLRKDTEIRFE